MPVKGCVIESDEQAFYYSRTGDWVKYITPAKAYVWDKDEVASIIELASRSGDWPLLPTRIHPAVYDDESGTTVVVGKASGATAIDKFDRKEVPNKGGVLRDIQATLVGLGVSQVVATDVSL